jgi:hypothetical protein
MADDMWYVGGVWNPRFQVLNPDTDVPYTELDPPMVAVLAPDGTRTAAAPAEEDEAVEDAWRFPVTASMEGDYSWIIESPVPHKYVVVHRRYAHPLP